jgi:hypothetical protein
VWGCGGSRSGELGNSKRVPLGPAEPLQGRRIRRIVGRILHCLAIEDGLSCVPCVMTAASHARAGVPDAVLTWGANSNGQLGRDRVWSTVTAAPACFDGAPRCRAPVVDMAGGELNSLVALGACGPALVRVSTALTTSLRSGRVRVGVRRRRPLPAAGQRAAGVVHAAVGGAGRGCRGVWPLPSGCAVGHARACVRARGEPCCTVDTTRHTNRVSETIWQIISLSRQQDRGVSSLRSLI